MAWLPISLQQATTMAQLVSVGSPAILDHLIGPSHHLHTLDLFFILASFFI